MRILIRLVLFVLLLAVVAAGAGLAYLFINYPDVPPAGAVKVEATPERLARGEYLARHVTACVDCHSDRDFTKFSGPVRQGTHGKGGERFDRENAGVPGTLFAPNITPAGIGGWTDGELLRAMRSGVSRDGRPLFPLMPYPGFARMAEDDAVAIVAYIRSLPAIRNEVPASSLEFPINLIVRTIPSHPAAFASRPSPADRVAYGEYLATIASCSECHTPIDEQGQPLPGRAFAGGNQFRLPPKNYRVRAANITPDADTGIGTWTEPQFVDRFKSFAPPDDRVLSDDEQRRNTAMPWTMYAGMTREDLGAIYAYLRSQKPVVNRVDRHPDVQMGGTR
jgi:mono/diheme cytochrome c family protein